MERDTIILVNSSASQLEEDISKKRKSGYALVGAVDTTFKITSMYDEGGTGCYFFVSGETIYTATLVKKNGC